MTTLLPDSEESELAVEAAGQVLRLQLYVAGRAPNSAQALTNLRAVCEEYFPDRCEVQIIDVLQDPLQAINNGILVTPTLVKLAPPPIVRIIGNLSEKERLLHSLGFVGDSPG